jgi:hypothetical protein
MGCTGAVVVASENSDPEAALVLKLGMEAGDEVFLPIWQVQKVFGEFNRSRDLLFVEDMSAIAATPQYGPAMFAEECPIKWSAPTAATRSWPMRLTSVITRLSIRSGNSAMSNASGSMVC